MASHATPRMPSVCPSSTSGDRSASVTEDSEPHSDRLGVAGGLMARLMKPAPDTAISAGAGAVRRSLSSASIRGP